MYVRGHHGSGGLIEKHAHGPLQEARAEREFDAEFDDGAAVGGGLKSPGLIVSLE
jgi:hypothetical protein